MKVKKFKKAASKTTQKVRTYSDVIRAARRGSAYAFAAGLGIWLPRTQAATLINLDSTSLPTGPLNTWANTGTVSGDFVSAGDTIPEVVTVDGVKAVALTNAPGTAGAAGTQYIGPATTAAVAGRSPRTVEAWIFDPEPTNQIEKAIFSFGRRVNPGNFALEHGASRDEGAVNTATANQPSASNAGNGGGDIGWNGTQNIVLGRWTYIAATYDGTELRVYSDGKLSNSKVAILDTALRSQDGSTNVFFRVGRQSINNAAASVSGVGVGPFYVSRIRVADTNLTEAQILANFNSEKGDFNLGDSDGDGLPDWWEIRHGLNPNSSTGADGASGDPDGDGATNLEEYNAGSDPQLADTDSDGINDGAELHRVNPVTSTPEPTDPTKADTDGDGLSDAVETGTGSGAGTNPTKADTDGDGYSDGLEIAKGTDPFSAASHPNPLVQLDATALATGALTTWTNNGTLSGNFAATQPTNAPNIELVDGVNAIHFRTIGGGGTNGQSYIGPAMPSQLGGANPKTIEAWVLDNVAQDELTVAAFGRRGGNPATGNNFELNMGQNDAYGAVAIWGAPDIGWNDNEVRGRWTHIVGTYDGNTTRVYVDGQLADAETIAIDTKLFAATAGGSATDSTTPLPIRVARQNNDTGGIDATGFGDITIAKVNMYDFALDAGSVKARFDEDKTNFNLGDTDGDGMPDWYEVRCGLDKNSDDSASDKDSDGLTNLQEYQAGTRADIADTDGDGINDQSELARIDPQTSKPLGTNPLNTDTDGDTLKDKVETDTGSFVSITDTGTDPNKADTDGDTFADNIEILQGSDPFDSNSIPDPSPLINLVATNALPAGTLNVWTNSGRLAGNFTAADGGGAFTNEIGAVADTVAGVNCLTFNGGTYVGPDATLVSGNPAFSCEAWVYNPSFADEETVISWGGRAPNGNMSAFGYGNDQNGWGAMTHWGADLGWNNTQIAAQWTHIAYTYNPQTGDQLCYINGTLANSNNIGSLSIDNFENGTTTPYPFRVGDEMNNDGTPAAGAGFHGIMSMAEIRVYSRVLDAGEIMSNFTAGAGVYGFADSDFDGMPDNYERQYSFLNPNDAGDASLDQDTDGLSNLEEYQKNTDPTNPDSDNDGLTDGDEVT